MADRDNHYEAAFEAFLRTQQVPYVAVDEAKRCLVAEGSLKSLDFIVSPHQGPAWLDRLLRGGKDPADQMVLKAAVDALDIIAPEIRMPGIRAEVY